VGCNDDGINELKLEFHRSFTTKKIEMRDSATMETGLETSSALTHGPTALNAYPRLIARLKLKFGNREDGPPLELVPTGITLFVGPNNSGKSLVLREIEKLCATYNRDGNLIVDEIDLNAPDTERIEADLKSREAEPTENERVPEGHLVIQRMNAYRGLPVREIVNLSQIEHWVKGNQRPSLSRYYLSFLTVRLDGETRTTLLRPQDRGDLLAPPTNILAALWVNADARLRIRTLTSEEFQMHFTIDALHGARLRARLAKRAPVDELEEQSLDTRARAYHSDSMEITDASDGVKAFTGMIATVLGQNYRIPLIDEPEAFLHPPLARRLGKELAVLATARNATVFAATHSADFLFGCVSGSPSVNIVRLTYKQGKASARLLSHERLTRIIKSPLMRSTGVLSALFHEGAVVCEGDSDRALYQEINDRLSAFDHRRSAEALFLNAHSKQATAKLAGPLREMGIPAAVVIDFDILKRNDDFKHLLGDISVPELLSSGWCQTKALIAQHCEENAVDWKRGGLRDIRDPQVRASVINLFENLESFGIFIVRNGELETWLSSLGVTQTNNKQQWLLDIFEKLGSDLDASGYVRPGTDDVWDFLTRIAKWINDPSRSGLN
jgi:ABC-type cobalamin/Fe3+-siderophores transport system ATPase subunit